MSPPHDSTQYIGAAPSGSSINCCTSTASSDISIDTINEEEQSKFKNNILEKFANMETNFKRCKPIDIAFENVKYSVRNFSFSERKFVTKEIIHGISGAFRSGELTAIMGPSGSGKSTLLNVMTGFRATGVTGKITVNGETVSTNSSRFRKLSCYIHQDDLLRPQLTVGETMMLAAHLKLGYKISNTKKINLIKHILSLLGLDHRYNVYTLKLSGGQKKRLAIALELISNPPVIYLDEPTTGLDSSSCSQCVALLKKLASQGHTIVCTIHQPSALIFEMFDKLYTVVEGNCMYQGPVRELIPFLNDQNLVCPSYHNPADFLMEVAIGDHPRCLNSLINAANKKYYEDMDLNELNRVTLLVTKIKEKINNKSIMENNNSVRKPAPLARIASYDYSKADATEELNLVSQSADLKNQKTTKSDFINETDELQPSSFFQQYFLLLCRIVKCSRRNYFLLMARLLSHIIIGITFGYLYQHVGTKATTVLGNYVYFYGSILLLVYTGKMAVVLTFPLEIDMLTREHFNRWYKLGPYFMAVLSFEIPFQSFCAALYIGISSYLTGNSEAESFRVLYFIILGVFATLSAQAWGFFVGATLPTKLAVFIGPILAVLFSVFGFCMRYIDITPFLRWMWHLSYFRAGFHGALNVIYGMDRKLLDCPKTEMYCHFRSPKLFLDYMMIQDMGMSEALTMMSVIIVVMHVLTVITLWHKLNKR